MTPTQATLLTLDLSALDADDYEGDDPEYRDPIHHVTYRSSGTYAVSLARAETYLHDPHECWHRDESKEGRAAGTHEGSAAPESGADTVVSIDTASDVGTGTGIGTSTDIDTSTPPVDFDAVTFVRERADTLSDLESELETGVYDTLGHLQAIADAESEIEHRSGAYDLLTRRARRLDVVDDLVLPNDTDTDEDSDTDETDDTSED